MTSVFPDGCPDSREKYVFAVTVNRPDPDGKTLTQQKTATVVATYNDVPVGRLEYGIGPGARIAITNMETVDEYQCRGCATQMRAELQKAFPDLELVDGGSTNSDVGDVIVARWQAQGILGDSL